MIAISRAPLGSLWILVMVAACNDAGGNDEWPPSEEELP
jgi:hypothetical protein